jgi:metal-responsive CopG/Arc/MetJ family transcriptional regulator
MKLKISVSLSSQAVKLIDSLPNKPARSEVIEEALVLYFKSRQTIARDKTDLDILNLKSASLNQEAIDVLDYQPFSRK